MRVPIFIFAFLAISLLNQPCEAIVGEILGIASSVTGLIQFVQELVEKFSDKSVSGRDTMFILEEMNSNVQYQLNNISVTLKELPIIFNHVNTENRLYDLINDNNVIFTQAIIKKKEIDAKSKGDRTTYVDFRKNEDMLEKNIIKIRNILLNKVMTSYLTKNFTEGLRLYENVCVTRMSHQQLLHGLLTQYKIALAQYFVTRNMIYDFVLPYKKDSHAFDNLRGNLRKNTHAFYVMVLEEYKKLMATASQEIWRCDASESDPNEPDGIYYELNAFSKYVFNERKRNPNVWKSILGGTGGICPTKCPAITKIDDCGPHDPLCSSTRKCSNNLLGCSNLHAYRTDETYFCVNTDSTAVKRYSSLVSHDNISKFYCSDGKQMHFKDLSYSTRVSANLYCVYCQCICPEKTYYISTKRTLAHIESNKVVTGARLVVEDNTIYIQIQQGTLLPDGIISNSSLQWLEIEKDNNLRVPISWQGIRSMDLMSFKFAKNSAVVGFGFQLSDNLSNRITLKPHACKFNFKEGKLGSCFDIADKPSPANELELNDVDVPTKGIGSNTPISNDNQFVTFTTTSMTKDGGQTTVPFIDTQKVVPRYPILLSGGGLFLRGRKGYGGFLALKLYTYNLVEHFDEYIELPEKMNW